MNMRDSWCNETRYNGAWLYRSDGYNHDNIRKSPITASPQIRSLAHSPKRGLITGVVLYMFHHFNHTGTAVENLQKENPKCILYTCRPKWQQQVMVYL